MADITRYSPQGGTIIGSDNRAYNIVDLARGGTPVNNEQYDITQFAPRGGIVIGSDGRAYDLTQLLAHCGDARTVDTLPATGTAGVLYITADGVYRYDSVKGWYAFVEGGAAAYGAYWDGSSSPTLTRLGDATGKTAGAAIGDAYAVNDFDNIAPWSGVRLCNVANDGTVIAYYGETGFSITGACTGYTYRVPVMVRIPKFYIKIVSRGAGREWWVSAVHKAGFSVHPAFLRPDGSEADAVFVGSELGGTETVGTVEMLTSTSGDDAKCNISRGAFRTLARARGTGWQQIDYTAYNALQILFLVEFASFDSHGKLGGSLQNFRYNADDKATTATTEGNDFVCANATAAYFDVGQTVGIGSSLGSFSIAQSRKITAKTALENGTETKITFDGAAVNIAVDSVIWSCAQRAGGADALGEKSGRAAGTIIDRCQNSYRGFKGFGGNAYTNIDGININDREWFLCTDPSKFADDEFDATDGYNSIGTAATDSGYQKSLVDSEDAPWAFLPATVGGGSTTYIPDYYYQSTGARALRVGGLVSYGASCGAWCWNAGNAASSGLWYFCGRLLYRKPA